MLDCLFITHYSFIKNLKNEHNIFNRNNPHSCHCIAHRAVELQEQQKKGRSNTQVVECTRPDWLELTGKRRVINMNE